LVIGYDIDAPEPYLILKNAWGTGWGEGGFYRMKINSFDKRSKGTCRVAGTGFNVVPVVV